MEKLNSNEIRYIAGFIDGEGCVGIRKHSNKSESYSLLKLVFDSLIVKKKHTEVF